MEEQRKQEIVDWGWCTCDGRWKVDDSGWLDAKSLFEGQKFIWWIAPDNIKFFSKKLN